ncbi:MAG TPA: MCE family protein [Nocardioidaceae bacterium]|nr:MCE family protein [Nocardioidaceae bacterium]
MRRLPIPHRHALLGVTYLLILGLLLALSVAAYRKALPWQRAVKVTLTTAAPGLELNPRSDVKFQGAIVGEVRTITASGGRAVVELALDESMLRYLPANVDAAIIPKTLFGEKYVDLRLPSEPVEARLAEGDTISQTTSAVELGQVFRQLVPILRAVRPDQLSVTLTNLADALDGRGEQIARTISRLDRFLGRIDPYLETFLEDLDLLAGTADVYSAATDDLMQLLDSSSALTTEVLLRGEDRLRAFLDGLSELSEIARTTLAENAGNLDRLTGESRRLLELLDSYSVALPCFLQALHDGEILANQVFGSRGPFTNLTLDLFVDRDPYRSPQDLPGNPNSDANDSNLPEGVPGFGPRCVQYASYVYGLTSPAPYSEPLPGYTPPGSSR